ncbi:MAG: transcriptional regulator [Candidatus Lokiarchaeota archaeon]|nr:transcriptional regulator [Candidatus Lokiarchaeota archaeon]
MKKEDTWKTRRQRLVELLVDQRLTLDLEFIMRELEYESKKGLIRDLRSISKSLKYENYQLVVSRPHCSSCGYVFKQKGKRLRIPTKCPKCKNERIIWPSVKIEF